MIDAPPVLPVADPIILAQLADVTLLVATAGFSDRREWNETLERLRKVDARLVGTVLLQPDSRVHATPTYRYAPSAAPAHWWVTEASGGSTPAPTDRGRRSAAGTAAATMSDPLLDDEITLDDDGFGMTMDDTTARKSADEAATAGDRSAVESTPQGRQVEQDEIVWQDSIDDGHLHTEAVALGAVPHGHVPDDDGPGNHASDDDVASGDVPNGEMSGNGEAAGVDVPDDDNDSERIADGDPPAS